MKELYNSPSDSKVVNYVSPVQDVKVIRASFLIETWKGHKWVQFENLKVPASTDYPGQQRYNNDIQI
ncbi:hypothetical protein, partial [Streptococcus sobrinus]|uniref:hypothetical protein n=1 Tax=Streptococcus sobrinus TaxID=1310 RepID=UPI001C400549